MAAAKAAGLIPDLANPLRDAALVRDALTQAGFAVRYVENADYMTLNNAVTSFIEETRSLGSEGLTVFYFAGHGVTVDAQPYLIPVSARMPALPMGRILDPVLPDPVTAPARAEIMSKFAVPLSAALGARPVSPDAPHRLIILDNCRDNPWFTDGGFHNLNQSGLPILYGDRSPTNLYVIAYAASAGAVALDGDGDNSPFAIALARNIPRANITIRQMLSDTTKEVRRATRRKQTPSVYAPSFITNNNCLVACVPPR